MRLELENFRHHRNKVYELPSTGVILLSGESGSGKSTLLTAIEFVLYGKVQKVNSFGAKGASVRLIYDGVALKQFVNEDKEHPSSLIIFRKKDPNLLELSVGNNKYVDSEAQEIINKLFGTMDIFLASSYLKQGSRSDLIDGSVKDKSTLIENFISDKGDIGKYKQLINEEIKNVLSKQNQCLGCIEMLEKQITSFKVLNTRKLKILEDDTTSRLASGIKLQDEVLSLSDEIKELHKIKVESEILEKNRKQIIDKNKSIQEELDSLTSKLSDLISTEDYSLLEARLSSIPTEIESARYIAKLKPKIKELDDLKNLLSFKLNPGVESLPEDDEVELTCEIRKLQSDLEKYNTSTETNKKVNSEIAVLEPFPNTSIGELQDELLKTKTLTKYKELLKTLPEKRDTIISEVEEPDSSLKNNLIMTISRLEEQQRARNQAIEINRVIEKSLEDIKSSEFSIAELEEQLEVVKIQEDIKSIPESNNNLQEFINIRNKIYDWKNKLSLVIDEIGDVNIDVGTLEEKLSIVKSKIEKHGSSVTCPSCNVDLLYSGGILKVKPTTSNSSTIQTQQKEVPSVIENKPKAIPSILAQMQAKKKPLPSLFAVKTSSQDTSTLPTVLPVNQSIKEQSNVVVKEEKHSDECESLDSLISEKIRLERNIKLLNDLEPPNECPYKELKSCEKRLHELDVDIKNEERREELIKRLDKRECKRNISEVIAEIDYLKQRETLIKKLIPLSPDKEEELEDNKNKLSELEEQFKLYKEYLEYKNYKERREQIENTINEMVKNIPDTNIVLRSIEDIEKDLSKLNKLDRLKSSLVSEPLKPDIEKIETLKTRLDYVKQQQKLYKLTEEYKLLHKNILKLEEEVNDLKTNILVETDKTEKELEEVRKSLVLKIKTFNENKEARLLIEKLKSNLSDVPPSVEEKIFTSIKKIEELEKRLNLLQEINGCESLLLQLKSFEKELKEKQEEAAIINRSSLLLQKIQMKSLEAEALAMDEVIASINQELSMQLESLFQDPITVRFDTSKTLQNGNTKFCINLAVNYRSEDYDNLNSLSGGELARVSLAITLALNKTANSPILMLDESLSALDADLIDDVIETLKSVSSQYNLPILVVLHNTCLGNFDTIVNF